MNSNVDTVVKLGGGVLAHQAAFETALHSIDAASRAQRLLIVPGGGPFADAVREADRRLALTDTAAHWMAVLAMDQYAHLIVSRLSRMSRSVLVSDQQQIAAALDDARIPVLAPSRWLQEVDPLPHTWEVTSDSIAAWVAGEVGAQALVLIKPPGASGESLVDSFFSRALPPHIRSIVVSAEDVAAFERS